jgi:cyanophycinase
LTATTRGPLLAIGGAEDKLRERTILRRVVDLSGNGHSRIAVIPTASGHEEAGQRYVRIFEEFGADHAEVVNIRDRDDANDAAHVRLVEECTGIFLTGGNQIRMSSVLGGTRVARAISDANRSGVPVAGTSAGASAMTAVMVAGGKRGRTPRANMVQMAPGLGLIDTLIIDQHFRERDRVARLLTMVSYNPGLIGIGIDEDTAALIGPDDRMEVLGNGSVMIVDGSQITSDIFAKRGASPLTIANAFVHFIASGGIFDLDQRRPVAVRW